MTLHPERIVRRVQFNEHLVKRQQCVPGQIRVADLGLRAKPRRLRRQERGNHDAITRLARTLIQEALQLQQPAAHLARLTMLLTFHHQNPGPPARLHFHQPVRLTPKNLRHAVEGFHHQERDATQ